MDIFEQIIHSTVEEATAKDLLRKQKSITRLFPSFPDRVKAVADKGGIRLEGVDDEQWHFKIHSGTKDNVWYDAYVRYNDLTSSLIKVIKDRRLWVKDKSRIDKRKMARKLMNIADIQISCSCPADKYYGGHYIRSLDKYNAKQGDRETRPPKERNPKQYGAFCKHLQNLMKVLPFYVDTMMRWLDDFYSDEIRTFEEETRKEYGWFKKAAGELQKKVEPDEEEEPKAKKAHKIASKDRKRRDVKEEPKDKKEEPEDKKKEEEEKKKADREDRKNRREKDKEDREEQKKKDREDRKKEKSDKTSKEEKQPERTTEAIQELPIKINWGIATGDSHFDALLRGGQYAQKRGVQNKIIYLHPDAYLKRAARYVGQSTQVFIKDAYPKTIDYLKKKMRGGEEMDMPFLYPYMDQQEGRHRAIAAKELGIDSIPVILFTKVVRK